MESFDLEPRYSTNEISGKCLKCLSEQELNNCLMQLLREEGMNEDVQRKYEALVAFLQSPESKQLRVESERYLSEGKQVSVRISNNEGKPKYELIIKKRSEPVMKIAAISEDGATISQHFGRAPLYVVVTVENGKVVSKERGIRQGTTLFPAASIPKQRPGNGTGMTPARSQGMPPWLKVSMIARCLSPGAWAGALTRA